MRGKRRLMTGLRGDDDCGYGGSVMVGLRCWAGCLVAGGGMIGRVGEAGKFTLAPVERAS